MCILRIHIYLALLLLFTFIFRCVRCIKPHTCRVAPTFCYCLTSLVWTATSHKMETQNKNVEDISKRIGITNKKVISQAVEYLRLLKIKTNFKGTKSEYPRIVLCLDISAANANEKFNFVRFYEIWQTFQNYDSLLMYNNCRTREFNWPSTEKWNIAMRRIRFYAFWT